ncbi:MAG: MBOAT family protein [Epsilonproteobacteria bacterium]|nr:MBOAT family protein [Campylobacterota bacterium]
MHLIILLSSISINYAFSLSLVNNRYKQFLLVLAIIGNLLPLIYFKYSLFLHLSTESLMLPLAISFYTFQQIAFLVDVYKMKVTPASFKTYLFFVMFFPQLIAGPIVHYRQIIGQVQQGAYENIRWIYIQAGIILFAIGLFKKVVLADQFFPIVDMAFTHLDTLSTFEAWVGIFAYSLGIYFDFSGYTDMAIGLGLLFGFKLPINFNSPYKAVNIVDFWRRWHITLSDFLKEYIYIPLGGNRRGEYREIFNLIITMTLAGIWHGSGWTFILWGLLHGILLAMVHLKNRYCNHCYVPKVLSIVITFMTVSLLWVIFRSHSMDEAWVYYMALFSISSMNIVDPNMYLVVLSMAIVWFLPNSIEFTKYQEKMKPFGWHYALVSALLVFIALKMMADAPAQTFVYFNF